MIDIDFVNIDNAKLIGRLLPFWARGRTVNLLLQALLSPMKSLHKSFRKWALERYIECHITAQKSSLEWYLKYALKSHFRNPSDNFYVVSGVNESIACFTFERWHNGVHWSNELKWGESNENVISENNLLTCFNTRRWNNPYFWNNDFLWENTDEKESETEAYEEVDAAYLESMGCTTVFAPAIVDTIVYNREDYERDIRSIMAKFMINFDTIKIIIANS